MQVVLAPQKRKPQISRTPSPVMGEWRMPEAQPAQQEGQRLQRGVGPSGSLETCSTSGAFTLGQRLPLVSPVTPS